MTDTPKHERALPGFPCAESYVFSIASDVEGSLATARHELDAIWNSARDACSECPDFDRDETRQCVDHGVFLLQQALWSAETDIERLREWIRDAREILRANEPALRAAGCCSRGRPKSDCEATS